MERCNVFLICTRCCDVLEAIFFVPAASPAVFDLSAVRGHGRTHPACVGAVVQPMSFEIDQDQYTTIGAATRRR